MDGLSVSIEAAKKVFFDRAAVINAIPPATRAVFSKFGAYVMKSARQSIRPARRKSFAEMSDVERKTFKRREAIARFYGRPVPKRPTVSSVRGQPPRSIKGTLKRLIFFGLDLQSRNVVMGPILSPSPTGAPEVLEHHGQTRLTSGPQKGKRIRVEARPFMQPAFEKILPQLKEMWRDVVKK